MSQNQGTEIALMTFVSVGFNILHTISHVHSLVIIACRRMITLIGDEAQSNEKAHLADYDVGHFASEASTSGIVIDKRQ